MRFKEALFFTVATLCCQACDHPKTQDALRGIQGSFNDAAKQFGPVADGVSSLTTEQLNKLGLIEYKVINISSNYSSTDMERILSKAGEERWDCFSVVATTNGLNVFCRRVPYSLLKEALRFM